MSLLAGAHHNSQRTHMCHAGVFPMIGGQHMCWHPSQSLLPPFAHLALTSDSAQNQLLSVLHERERAAAAFASHVTPAAVPEPSQHALPAAFSAFKIRVWAPPTRQSDRVGSRLVPLPEYLASLLSGATQVPADKCIGADAKFVKWYQDTCKNTAAQLNTRSDGRERLVRALVAS
jgi:hypothetical protein